MLLLFKLFFIKIKNIDMRRKLTKLKLSKYFKQHYKQKKLTRLQIDWSHAIKHVYKIAQNNVQTLLQLLWGSSCRTLSLTTQLKERSTFSNHHRLLSKGEELYFSNNLSFVSSSLVNPIDKSTRKYRSLCCII